MYCSTCGVALAKGLSFCNYCGAKLPSTEAVLEFREVRPQLLVSAMAGVFVLGLPGITFLIFMLNAVRLDSGQMMAFAWTTLLLLVALEAFFVVLLLRRKPLKDEPPRDHQFRGPQTNELEARRAGALSEPAPSVTEHTTRAFDPIGMNKL